MRPALLLAGLKAAVILALTLAPAAAPPAAEPATPGLAQVYGVWTLRCAVPSRDRQGPAACQLTAARSVLDGASLPVGISIDIARGGPPSLAFVLGQGRFAPEPVRLQVDDGLPVEVSPSEPNLVLVGGDSAAWLLAAMSSGRELAAGFTIAATGARTVLTIPLAGFADALDAIAAHHAAAEGVRPAPPHRLTRPGPPQTP